MQKAKLKALYHVSCPSSTFGLGVSENGLEALTDTGPRDFLRRDFDVGSCDLFRNAAGQEWVIFVIGQKTRNFHMSDNLQSFRSTLKPTTFCNCDRKLPALSEISHDLDSISIVGLH